MRVSFSFIADIVAVGRAFPCSRQIYVMSRTFKKYWYIRSMILHCCPCQDKKTCDAVRNEILLNSGLPARYERYAGYSPSFHIGSVWDPKEMLYIGDPHVTLGMALICAAGSINFLVTVKLNDMPSAAAAPQNPPPQRHRIHSTPG